MRKTARSLILVSLQVAVLVLSGCASPLLATPTSTSKPDNTPTLTNAPTITATRTARLTFTSIPSLTFTASATPVASLAAEGPLSPEGPWFFYAATYYQGPECCGSNARIPPLYLTNPDGSGRAPVLGTFMDEDLDGMVGFASPSNRLSDLGGAHLLFRLGEDKAFVINNLWPQGPWHEAFVKADGHSGFLAITSNGTAPSALDLLIYQLPDLKILSRIPLVVCPAEIPDCLKGNHYKSQMNSYSRSPVGDSQQLVWSPDGRYLAFAAIRSSMSSDLYLYDSANGNVRELTGGDDDIGKVWWSPDGKWIIFESLSESQESLWVITPDASKYRQLYTADRYGPGLGISAWIKNGLFLTQEGISSWDFVQGLRLANLESGKVTLLFQGSYHSVIFDPNSGIFLVSDLNNYWYWLTEANPIPKMLKNPTGDYEWDPEEQAIVKGYNYPANSACKVNEVAIWTPDVIHCRPIQPATTKAAVFTSPDGLWRINVEGGIWLEKASGEQVNQVGQWTEGQVIWRPDSKGFFLDAEGDQRYSLYFVSIPDLTLSLVDDRVGDEIFYQWLEADSY